MILGEASLHVRGPMGKVLLAAAAYLVAVAMLSRGPLGAIRIVGPRLHQVLDLVLVAALVVSPIIVTRVVSHADLDTAGIIIIEALAIVLLRMATRTHYVPLPRPVVAAKPPPAVRRDDGDDTPPTPAKPAATAAGGGDGAPSEAATPHTEPQTATAGGGAGDPATSEEGGDGAPPGTAKPQTEPRRVPSTSWTLGVLAARARRRGTGSEGVLGDGARRLGTALGRANRRRGD